MIEEKVTTSCACIEVHYNPKQNEDGTARDRWTCKLCGSEYVPLPIVHTLVEQVEVLEEENQLQEVYIKSLEDEMEDLDDLLDEYRDNE